MKSSQTYVAINYMWYKIVRIRNIRNVGKGKVQYRNYKRLKIGSGHAHGHSIDLLLCSMS